MSELDFYMRGDRGFISFFSSRRRHTRYWRGLSSDVCSSDLSDVLIKSLILFLLYGIFIFLVTSTISTFIKSSVKCVILSFVLIATLQMFNKWYNPFSYWRVGKDRKSVV